MDQAEMIFRQVLKSIAFSRVKQIVAEIEAAYGPVHETQPLSTEEQAMNALGEAVEAELPDKRRTNVGAAKDPNSARGLAESFLRTHGRFVQDEFYAFLNSKRPDLSKSSGVQALTVLTKTGLAKKEGFGSKAVYLLAEPATN
jgi:hypothetical protein